MIQVTPDFPRGRLYPGDQVFVTLITWRQDLRSTVIEKAVWDGEAFIARMILPPDCEWASVRVHTPDQFFRGKGIAPQTESGEIPPGTRVMASCRPRSDLSSCDEAIKSTLEEHPNLWWLYPKIWGLRERILKNITTEEVISQLRSMNFQETDPSLLRTRAFGHWYAKQPEQAMETLTELCARFPDSGFAVRALNDAEFRISTEALEHLKPRLEQLQAKVVSEAPNNPRLWQDRRTVLWLWNHPRINLVAMRGLFEAWVKEAPADPYPHLLLANALFKGGASGEEAERLIDRSIELYFMPLSYVSDKRLRELAFRVRSQLRLRKGDVAGALADIKMAQESNHRGSVEDLEIKAAIWRRIGHLRTAEEILVDAYRKGSAKAEEGLKSAYVTRTGDSRGFKDYVMARLAGNGSEAEPAPEIEGTTLDGIELTSKSLKGKPVVVNFWFMSCGPCIKEIPKLNSLATEFAGKARFLAFATDDAEPLREFLKDREFRYEIVPSSSRLARAFGVEAYPSHYIIDGEDNIVRSALGAGPKTLEILGNILQRLLSDKPFPVKGLRKRRG